MELEGKTAIVTGASRGIGVAIALRLTAEAVVRDIKAGDQSYCVGRVILTP